MGLVFRVFVAFVCCLPLLFVTGCSEGVVANGSESGKVNVVATIFPPYDFTRAVAGELADVSMLLPPASESHSFEPTPQDVLKISNCDIFIYIGGESEDWVDRVLSSVDTSKMTVVRLMDCVESVEEEFVEGMQTDETAHDVDEHIWTSPRNAALIVERIAGALCAVDADNADKYRANVADYCVKLDALDAEFKDVVEAATRKTVVFGDRFPFRYLADAYGLSYYAAFPGCSTDSEASAATIAFLSGKVKEEGIPVVFHAELNNGKTAKTIAEASGAKVMELHACHNISRDDFTAGRTYLDIMTANAAALREALN